MNPPSHHRDDDGPPPLVASHKSLASFQEDVQYLWCSDIPVYETPPTALHFLRNHVAVSRPCIIRNSILTREDAPSATDGTTRTSREAKSEVPLTMTLDDLVRVVRDNHQGTNDGANAAGPHTGEPTSFQLPPLCVDVTPDGHGDCLRTVTIIDGELNEEGKVFVKPLELEMSLSDFCSRLRKGRAKQRQQNPLESDQEEILDKVFDSSCKGNPNLRKKDIVCNDDFFENSVLYYSRQNDCLRQELAPLWNLKQQAANNSSNDSSRNEASFVFPRSFQWAEEAFFGHSSASANGGCGSSVGPDAVNLWMGDERAVSAMHKDHYENLFYVLSGEKVFGLCPPSDAPFLYEREVLSGRFEASGVCKEGEETDARPIWSVSLDRERNCDGAVSFDEPYSKVHWIATDLFRNPLDRTKHDEEFPLSKYAHPITVKVRAGELLYLPSLWFHRVTQTTETVGINYWYDMNFESPMWCYFHFLQQLKAQEK